MAISRTRNYLKGLVTGYTVNLVNAVVGLWLTPFILRFLDRQEYGIFTLCGDLLMWLALLDLGISAGLRVQAAQVTGRPDAARLNGLASTAFFGELGVVGLALLGGAGLVAFFPAFFQVRPDLQFQAQQVLALMVFSTALSLGTQTFASLLVAHQQIHLDNLIRLGLIVIRAGVTVLLLLWGWKLLSLAVASLAATAVTAGLAVLRTYRLLPELRLSWRQVSWQFLRSLGHLGIWFTLGGLAGLFIQSLGNVMAAKLVSLEAVTTLALTGKVYVLSWLVLSQITNTARPALGQLLGQGRTEAALEAYRHLFALSTGGAIVIAFSLWAANGNFVTWWVGGQNYGGWLLDLGLALNLIVHTWVLPNRATLSAGLLVKGQVICRLIEGLLNFLLCLWLGLHFGLVGIVFATSITGVLTSLWYLPWLTARMFHRNFAAFICMEVKNMALVGLALAPVAWLARTIGANLPGITGAGLACLLTALAGAALLWLIAFDHSLRQKILKTANFSWRTS